jgi:hypothetical protein
VCQRSLRRRNVVNGKMHHQRFHLDKQRLQARHLFRGPATAPSCLRCISCSVLDVSSPYQDGFSIVNSAPHDGRHDQKRLDVVGTGNPISSGQCFSQALNLRRRLVHSLLPMQLAPCCTHRFAVHSLRTRRAECCGPVYAWCALWWLW